jgi:hypothetical protein
VWQQLEDLDIADDICLLLHAFDKICMKQKDLENVGNAV